MNERIRELALQAGYQRINDYYTNGTVTAFTDEQIEKFAELIVGECILTIQMGITRDGHNTEKYLRSMKHIKQIRKHFGVE
jgi:hypothetical protein